MFVFLIKSLERIVNTFIVILLFLLASLLPAQTKTENKNKTPKVNLSTFIIGKWQTIQNSMTTSYLTLDFKKDKNFTYILRSNWNADYHLLKDGRLITHAELPMLNKTVTDTSFINLKKDTLIITINNKNNFTTNIFYRKKTKEAKKETGLVGNWYCQDYSGYPADLTITKSGKYELSQVLRAFKATYEIKDDHFIVHSGKTTLMNMKFQKFNDDMIVYGNGPNMRLKRVN